LWCWPGYPTYKEKVKRRPGGRQEGWSSFLVAFKAGIPGKVREFENDPEKV